MLRKGARKIIANATALRFGETQVVGHREKYIASALLRNFTRLILPHILSDLSL